MTTRLTVEHCIAIYDQDVHAGVLVDRARLEGAVEAPYAGFSDVERFPTLIEKAARLAYGVAQAQAFSDGNKRIAWLMAVTFLAVNGTEIDVDQDEAAHVIRALGEKTLDLDGLTDWFVRCVDYYG